MSKSSLLMSVSIILIFLSCSNVSSPESSSTNENIFIKGVDVSTLNEVESSGVRFYYNGIQSDAIKILKNFGVNWIRVRIWNNPYGDLGNPYGGGNCDYTNMTKIVLRAKNEGIKVLLDFHYSDWWADPGKQNKPKSWTNLRGNELISSLTNFTLEVLNYMKSKGVVPDMIQVGNEVNNGFLWPDGMIVGTNAGGFSNFVKIFNSAYDCIKSFDNKILVILHLAGDKNKSFFDWFLGNVVNLGIKFDMLGLSYYPYWHGDLNYLKELIDYLSKKYSKPILIVETAYAWTLSDYDGYPNVFGSNQIVTNYPPTKDGQNKFLLDFINVLKSFGKDKVLGFFYWEGCWVGATGWSNGLGNPWDNQTLFDWEGNPLPSLDVFKN